MLPSFEELRTEARQLRLELKDSLPHELSLFLFKVEFYTKNQPAPPRAPKRILAHLKSIANHKTINPFKTDAHRNPNRSV